MVDTTILAQALGFISFGLGFSVFYQKNDRHLKILMLIFNLNHLLHFLLLGSMVSALSALLSALRTTTAIFVSSKRVAAVFIVISLVSGFWVAEQWHDLWPIIGTVIGTYSVFCLSGIRMRIGFLLGASCWLTNNILVGSIGGTLLEMTVIVMNLLTIYRLHRQQSESMINQSSY
ncbi:YgjV family protein [Vibrio parahaemolyticus]|uniref:YgjV family protein n=2 Tax=Vibrio parahaemolyticus TaxID=670 RepID=UPI001122564C|nr:YgjV family protein [Vibrio parahaemolyticus]MBE4265471.1 YgjV family protein [Vibrio parahaemolyticus]MBE4414530.1 YgjV family protein [Vibrio parahaemolyticus]TOQ50501.1 permease [Vibrio parahaemolyticus]HAS6503551.1 YgjV family protein [Vibrio parahaemolyticus]HCG5577804.1 YgjV family protein [Vibrio parahaemolyticus]